MYRLGVLPSLVNVVENLAGSLHYGGMACVCNTMARTSDHLSFAIRKTYLRIRETLLQIFNLSSRPLRDAPPQESALSISAPQCTNISPRDSQPALCVRAHRKDSQLSTMIVIPLEKTTMGQFHPILHYHGSSRRALGLED